MSWTMNASGRPSRRVPGSMEGVSNTRRVTKKQNKNAQLTLIDGGYGRPGRAELAELREQFAASGAPAEVLQVLDASDDVEEALERLLTAGLLPEPEESLAGLLDGWTPTLEAGCDTMAAELFGAEFLGMIGQSIPDDVVLPELLTGLIDHELGGGVKDCFPTDRPDWVRTRYQRAAQQFGFEFRDYKLAEAGAILRRALGSPPCPVEADQIEDVRDFLGLLRTRVDLLPASGPAARTGQDSARGPVARTLAGRTVHRVKITLRGAKPPIWRRLEVPSDITLQRLHLAVQQAFGWADGHMWVFSTPAGEYGTANPELGHRSAAAKKLSDVAPRAGGRIRYTYDFGDDWEHDIAVEDVLPAEPDVAYPRCTAGRRACPPEDSGGIWGYEYLLEVLANPGHEEHADRLDWLGLDSADQFDPAAFDLTEVNEALSGLASVLVKR